MTRTRPDSVRERCAAISATVSPAATTSHPAQCLREQRDVHVLADQDRPVAGRSNRSSSGIAAPRCFGPTHDAFLGGSPFSSVVRAARRDVGGHEAARAGSYMYVQGRWSVADDRMDFSAAISSWIARRPSSVIDTNRS